MVSRCKNLISSNWWIMFTLRQHFANLQQLFSSQTWTFEKLILWHFFKNRYPKPFPSSPSLAILSSKWFLIICQILLYKIKPLYFCFQWLICVFEIYKIMRKMVSVPLSASVSLVKNKSMGTQCNILYTAVSTPQFVLCSITHEAEGGCTLYPPLLPA